VSKHNISVNYQHQMESDRHDTSLPYSLGNKYAQYRFIATQMSQSKDNGALHSESVMVKRFVSFIHGLQCSGTWYCALALFKPDNGGS
jgi:hypothetical protein